MSSDRAFDKQEIDGMEHQQEQEPDFFSLFGLPSYEDSINFGSSITSSIRRPVSAILAVVDNALAALNEEFESSEESWRSLSSNHTDTNEQVTNNQSDHMSDNKVSGCYRRTRRTKTSKMGTIDSSSTSHGGKQNSVESLSDSDDIQSSVIGSISKLELHEDYNGKEHKKVGINSNITDNLQDDLVSDLAKKVDSSEYCVVESDMETKDGWLVVIDQ